MHRISIAYKNIREAPFNWEYYMNNHLPLAVGTSRRHSGLIFCDVDKTIDADSPYVCVCMVHFDSEQSVSDFCQFFALQHPESLEILSDEPNYTTITPNFVASEWEESISVDSSPSCSHRIKLIYPAVDKSAFKREEASIVVKRILTEAGETAFAPVSSEIDICTSGIIAGSEPDYSLIWTVGFDRQENTGQFYQWLMTVDDLQDLKKLIRAEPEILVSQVLPFDLSKSESYYRR